MKMIDEL